MCIVVKFSGNGWQSYLLFVLSLCVWQYKEGKKLKPKPNYNSVDLSEVEWEDTEEKVSNTHTFLSFSILCFVFIVKRVYDVSFSWGQPWLKEKPERYL